MAKPTVKQLQERITQLEADLLAATRWARIFREQRDAARRTLAQPSDTIEQRRDALAKAKARAIETGSVVRV